MRRRGWLSKTYLCGNQTLTEYFKTLPHVKLASSDVHYSKARNSLTGGTSQFINGDRFVFVKAGFDPPIPEEVKIGDYTCHVWYSSREPNCKRCRQNHRTSNVDNCEAYREHQPDVKVFTSGICSNFDRTPVTIGKMLFKTSEHAYQWHACTEYVRDDLAEKVFHARTPRDAKLIASEVKIDNADWAEKRYDVMKTVLREKAKCSKKFRNELLTSGEHLWVECSATDLFWGSGLSYGLTITTDPGHYPGQNHLGKLLGVIREELRQQDTAAAEAVQNKDNEPQLMDTTITGTSDTQQTATQRPSRSLKKTRSQDRSSSVPTAAALAKLNTPMIQKLFKQQAKKKRLADQRRISERKTGKKQSQEEEDDTASVVSSVGRGSTSSFGQFVDRFLDRDKDFEDDGS